MTFNQEYLLERIHKSVAGVTCQINCTALMYKPVWLKHSTLFIYECAMCGHYSNWKTGE